jgi:hypothetical protein
MNTERSNKRAIEFLKKGNKIKIPGASPFAERKTFSFLESGVFYLVLGL